MLWMFNSFHFISLRNILILSSHLRLCLPSSTFSSASLNKHCIYFCTTPPPTHAPLWHMPHHSIFLYLWESKTLVFASLALNHNMSKFPIHKGYKIISVNSTDTYTPYSPPPVMFYAHEFPSLNTASVVLYIKACYNQNAKNSSWEIFFPSISCGLADRA